MSDDLLLVIQPRTVSGVRLSQASPDDLCHPERLRPSAQVLAQSREAIEAMGLRIEGVGLTLTVAGSAAVVRAALGEADASGRYRVPERLADLIDRIEVAAPARLF